MTSEEIKKYAYAGDRSEWEWMSLADKLLWHECAEIYRLFKVSALNHEEGQKKIAQAVREYEHYKTVSEQGYNAHNRLAKLYKDIEVCASSFSMNPNIDTAWKLMECIYGKIQKETINGSE